MDDFYFDDNVEDYFATVNLPFYETTIFKVASGLINFSDYDDAEFPNDGLDHLISSALVDDNGVLGNIQPSIVRDASCDEVDLTPNDLESSQIEVDSTSLKVSPVATDSSDV